MLERFLLQCLVWMYVVDEQTNPYIWVWSSLDVYDQTLCDM